MPSTRGPKAKVSFGQGEKHQLRVPISMGMPSLKVMENRGIAKHGRWLAVERGAWGW